MNTSSSFSPFPFISNTNYFSNYDNKLIKNDSDLSLFQSKLYQTKSSKIINKTFNRSHNKPSRALELNKSTLANTSTISTLIPKKVTDDQLFALSEIQSLDKKLKKSESSKLHVWDLDYSSKIYDRIASKNKHDLIEIRNKVRNGTNNNLFDLRNEIEKKKYFPIENVDTIEESEQIMKSLLQKKIKPKTKYTKKANFTQFASQNREICKQNFLIDFLKKERKGLNDKEESYKTALIQANQGYERDLEKFNNFLNQRKTKFKDIEFKLTMTIKDNKKLLDEKKELQHQSKNLQTNIEKTINKIILYKRYADFVHKALSTENKISKAKIEKIDFSTFEKNIEENTKKFISKFEFLLDDNDIEYRNYGVDNLESFFINPRAINNLFFCLENGVIKELHDKEEFDDKNFEDKINEEKVLNKLKIKLESYQFDEDRLKSDIKITKDMLSQGQEIFEEKVENYSPYIEELYEALSGESIESHPSYNLFMKDIYEETNTHNTNKSTNKLGKSSKYTKYGTEDTKKNIKYEGAAAIARLNFINEILNDDLKLIKEKENTVIMHIDEIESFENTKIEEDKTMLRKIINKIKEDNRLYNYRCAKELQKKIEIEKKLKILQNRFRYKVNGPITFPPPNVVNEKKKNEKLKIKENKKINNNEMLEYH